jgi:hypothetical protein
MATQLCLDRIKKESPPLYCGQGGTSDICGQIQVDINKYCQHNNVATDTPVPQFTGGGKCWCCCSCMAWGTPVESSKGNFRLIETIEKGDHVLSTGGKLGEWSESQVTGVGGIAPGTSLAFCYTVRFKLTDGTQRLMTSTADHLFLIPGGELKPIQDLRPGQKVIQADGGEATVELIAIGEFSGGVRNFTLGIFDPTANPDDPYKGHLVNTYGLVTADLAVQSAFYQREFGSELASSETPSPIGSKEFFEKYGTKAYEEFVADPKQWPAHFKPISGPVFNIPKSAALYFSESQSIALLRVGGSSGLGNSQAVSNFMYLKKLFRGFYGDIYYMPDWTEDTPNAWHFNQMGQHFIVVSGGLLRLPTLSVAGLSIILSHLVAQSQGVRAVGEADYEGIVGAFRDVWHERMFFEMYEKGSREIKATFALLNDIRDDQPAREINDRPSLQGRLAAIMSGGCFGGVPDSAKP